MRVGFVSQLLWDRYGPFWAELVRDAGAQPLVAPVDGVREALDDARVAAVAPLAFRLAAAQALALHDADALVVPALNAELEAGETAGGAVARGGAADPWIADFPDALRASLAGLPPLVAVPASLERGIEGAAVTALQNLLHDAHGVRRVWGRLRAQARPPARPAPRWTLLPSERRTVGLVGQPWLLSDAIEARVTSEGEHLVSQHRLDPRRLREEGARLEPKLAPTDLEALGAGRLFARRGGVSALRFLADRDSGADAWLLGLLQTSVRKPIEVRYLQDVLQAADPIDMLSTASVD